MEHESKVCQECNDGDREGGNEMKNSIIIFIFTCVISCAQLEEFPKRDKKLLKFKKDIDKIAEDLENFAFDIAKEIVEKSDLFMITDYDYADYSSEEYSTEKATTTEAREHNQANEIVKEAVGTKKNSTKLQKPSKTRRKRSLDTALSQNNHEQCYQKPPAEQHLEKIHIEDLKEEVKHLYELINILRGEQGIFFALDREKDDDLAPRINSKDLLRTLEELNNEDPHKEFSTHKELAKIKSDLRRAITALDSTKTVLVQERRKELALEAELQRQQLQLQMLMENRTKPENDSFVGAALHLPKALPEQKVEAGVRARSNDLEDLVRLLDRIKQPKKLSRLQELLSRDPQPSKQDQNASSKLHQLIELLEQVQGRDDDEEVEDELQQLQNAIQKLKPKEDPEVLFAGREKPGDRTTAKLTQQQLVELRKKLDQMISSGGSGSGLATSNVGTGKISPPHPFWYANYRNFGPYFNYQGPTAYGYERGQYGPEQIPPYAGFDGSRYYPENNPYGNDFWTNRYRYTTDVNNRFFPANIHLPEDFNAGDPGQAGPHLPPDYRTKDIEELRNQIDALQNVIDTMNFQNYGKRPEDEATIANLEKQIKDLRGIVNGLNQEVAPNYNQHPPSNIQPLPSYNQPPPTYNQQPFIHETPNNLSQQPYEAHQVTKRSAIQESDTPLNYNQASPSFSQSLMSFNKPFPSNNFPSPSNNQDHQVIKKSTVPENNPALTQLLNGDFKSKNIAVENNPTSQKSNEIHNQPPPNYNKFSLNYNQPPLSYSQPSLSYGQPPLNYNQPPLIYNQPLPKRSSTDSQLLDDVYSKLKSYLLDDKRSSNYDATEERISRLRAQLDNHLDSRRYDQLPLGMTSRAYASPYEQLGYYNPGNYQVQKNDGRGLMTVPRNDLLGAVIVRIMDKIMEIWPVVFERLLGGSFYGLLDDGYGQNSVQVMRNFGVAGLIPLFLLKIIGSMDVFFSSLKRNQFFRSFFAPAFILFVVYGSIVFLVWLQGGSGNNEYRQITYENTQDIPQGYPNQYPKGTRSFYGGNYGYPAPSVVPGYSKSYYENEQKVNRKAMS